MRLTVHLYRRMMRRGRVLSLLALSAIPGLVFWLTAFDAAPAAQESIYADVVTTSGFAYAIAALILTVATLREERDGGTLPYIYMRPIKRVVIAASAMTAAVLAATTLAVGGWLTTLLAVAVAGGDLGFAMPGAIQFLAAAVGYSAVFVPLGYLVPRATLIGIGYIVIVETILGSAIEAIGHLSIWRIAASIYADVAPRLGSDATDLLGTVTVGVTGGVVKLAAILAVGLGTLTWALRRRDAL